MLQLNKSFDTKTQIARTNRTYNLQYTITVKTYSVAEECLNSIDSALLVNPLSRKDDSLFNANKAFVSQNLCPK